MMSVEERLKKLLGEQQFQLVLLATQLEEALKEISELKVANKRENETKKTSLHEIK